MTQWSSISDHDLKNSMADLIQKYPPSERVLERVIAYFDANKTHDRSDKKRKIDSDNILCRIVDISFQSPRKKLDLILTQSEMILHNTKTNSTEYQIRLSDIMLGVCVPSPEKALKSYTFVIFPSKEDAIVFNIQEKGEMVYHLNGEHTLTADKHTKIIDLLTHNGRIDIIQPTDTFLSTSKNKTHVVAYLKAKDGYLFFLSQGILFGFKKPTLYVPIQHLASSVISNVTQHTFDLTLTLKPHMPIIGSPGFRLGKEGDDDIIQFSMIAQSEYEGILKYIQKIGINDASMAEERKAVIHNKEAEEEEEEQDDDFEPSEEEDEPLEYDTDASHHSDELESD